MTRHDVAALKSDLMNGRMQIVPARTALNLIHLLETEWSGSKSNTPAPIPLTTSTTPAASSPPVPKPSPAPMKPASKVKK